MHPDILGSFADEIVKLASAPTDARAIERAYKETRRSGRDATPPGWVRRIRGESRQRTRDYLASALIGAAAAPSLALVGKLLGRALRNRAIRRRLAHGANEQI